MTASLSLARPAVDIGLVVEDVDRCLEFYRDTIGLAVRREMTVEGVGRMVILTAGEASFKLVQLSKPVRHHAAGGGLRGGATGFRYCTFPVDDIEAVLARCEAAGHPATLGPVTVAEGMRLFAVADPEGNWVEFLETRPPGETS
jgi:catechol 2,3-dioxygenase-like lactoylglutathione lyase family enzyme